MSPDTKIDTVRPISVVPAEKDGESFRLSRADLLSPTCNSIRRLKERIEEERARPPVAAAYTEILRLCAQFDPLDNASPFVAVAEARMRFYQLSMLIFRFHHSPSLELIESWPDKSEREEILRISGSGAKTYGNVLSKMIDLCDSALNRFVESVNELKTNVFVPLMQAGRRLCKEAYGPEDRKRAQEITDWLAEGCQLLSRPEAHEDESYFGSLLCYQDALSLLEPPFTSRPVQVAPLVSAIAAEQTRFVQRSMAALSDTTRFDDQRLNSLSPVERGLLRLGFLWSQSPELTEEVLVLVGRLEESTDVQLALSGASLVKRGLLTPEEVRDARDLLRPREMTKALEDLVLRARRSQAIQRLVAGIDTSNVPLDRLSGDDFETLQSVLSNTEWPPHLLRALLGEKPKLLMRPDRLMSRLEILKGSFDRWCEGHPGANPNTVTLEALREHESPEVEPAAGQPLIKEELRKVLLDLEEAGWNSRLVFFLLVEGFFSRNFLNSGKAYIPWEYPRANIQSFVPQHVLDREVEDTMTDLVRVGAIKTHKKGNGVTLNPHPTTVSDPTVAALLTLLFRPEEKGRGELRGTNPIVKEVLGSY